jgi:hypothetical protein
MPDHDKRRRLLGAVQRVEYPECRPLSQLLKKADLAIASLRNWNIGGAGQAVSAHALIGAMHRMNVQNVDRPEHFVRIFLYPVLMAPALSRPVTAQASSGPAVQQAKHRLNRRKSSAMNNDRRKANGGWPSL